MTEKPTVSNSSSQKEIDKVEKKFDQFKEEINNLTLDRMNEAKKEETEPQTKISSKEKSNVIFLKPKRQFNAKEKFNEKFRNEYNFACERVNFIAENIEIIGETLDFWTKPFAGMPTEEWEVPVNKPVNAPRYVAEQIKRCTYHRLVMQDKPVSADGMGTYYGTMIADVVKQRLDAHPINDKKSVFVGASGF